MNMIIYFKKKLFIKDLVSNENSNQKSDDSVTSKQESNYTNDKFTGFGGMEQQRRYDEIKLNFKLNYDFNTTDMLNNNDINCFMTKNEIYNNVKLHIEVKSFGSFPPSNDIIKNLPFAIDNIKSPIININKKTTLNQNLDNLDMFRFNEVKHGSINSIINVHVLSGLSFQRFTQSFTALLQ